MGIYYDRWITYWFPTYGKIATETAKLFCIVHFLFTILLDILFLFITNSQFFAWNT